MTSLNILNIYVTITNNIYIMITRHRKIYGPNYGELDVETLKFEKYILLLHMLRYR